MRACSRLPSAGLFSVRRLLIRSFAAAWIAAGPCTGDGGVCACVWMWTTGRTGRACVVHTACAPPPPPPRAAARRFTVAESVGTAPHSPPSRPLPGIAVVVVGGGGGGGAPSGLNSTEAVFLVAHPHDILARMLRGKWSRGI